MKGDEGRSPEYHHPVMAQEHHEIQHHLPRRCNFLVDFRDSTAALGQVYQLSLPRPIPPSLEKKVNGMNLGRGFLGCRYRINHAPLICCYFHTNCFYKIKKGQNITIFPSFLFFFLNKIKMRLTPYFILASRPFCLISNFLSQKIWTLL